MIDIKEIQCPRCGGEVRKNGLQNYKQRVRCKNSECDHQFSVKEEVSGWKDSIKTVIKKDNEKVKIETTGNNSKIVIKSESIDTVEELLEFAGVDLDIWRLEKHSINKSNIATKNEDDVSVTPIFEVKAFLTKKVPDIQQFPVVQPLEITSSNPGRFSGLNKPGKAKFKKALILPDTQTGYMRDLKTGELDPFHDRRCLDIALQVVSKTKPEVIVLLGDMIDLPDWSDKFIRSPEFYFTTQPALIELGWFISQLRILAPDSKIVYIFGNHENRMHNAVINNLSQSYGLKPYGKVDGPDALSLEYLLQLKESNVECISDYPNGEYWINQNLKVIHGNIAKSGSGETTRELLKNARASVIHGHIHRMEFAAKTVHIKDKIISYGCYSMGCFCRIDGIVPAAAAANNWQQGFGIVDFEDGNGHFQVQPYSINDGKTLFDGELIVGDENSYLKQLKKDTGWKF